MLLTMAKRSKDRVAIEIIDETGQTIYQKLVNRYTEKDVRWLSRVSQWSIIDVTTHLNNCCDSESSDSDVLTTFEDINPPQSLVEVWTTIPKSEEPPQSLPQFQLYCREINQLRSSAKVFSHETVEPCLREAF